MADLALPKPSGPRILIYHQVGFKAGREMEVTLENFLRQIDWLQANRELVDLESAVRRWEEDQSDKLVVITFDDGYKDTFTTAFPILKERSIPFVVYVTTEIVETARDDRHSGAIPVSWGELEVMLASGLMTLGAHTRTHRDLRTLTEEEVIEELATSDDVIAERLGIPPRHFAYPFGYWSPTADGPVRHRYETAVLGGSPRPRAVPEPHMIHRYPIQLSDGFRFFMARVNRGLRAEETVRRALKGYSGP